MPKFLTYLAFYRERKGLNCLVGENTAEFELEKVAGEINPVLSEGTGEKMEEVLSNYLIRIKMEKARELLLERNLIVKEVAYQTGYTDQNYFSKVFKQYYGYPPTDLHL